MEIISPMRKAQVKLGKINVLAIKQENIQHPVNLNDDFLDAYEELEKLGEVSVYG